MSTLGQRLKGLRQTKEGRPTQKDVAEAIGYTRETYANWEIDRGEPPHDALRALAKYFECTSDYLLGLTDKPRPETPSAVKSADDDQEFNFKLAAHNDGEYGREPSPELRSLIHGILQEELADYILKKK